MLIYISTPNSKRVENDLNAYLMIKIILIAVPGGIIAIALIIAIIVDCIQLRRKRRRLREQQPAQGSFSGSGPGPSSNSSSSSSSSSSSDSCTYGFDVIDSSDLGLCYGNMCNVCYKHMDGKSTIGRINGCNHAFHRSCILQWYQSQRDNGEISVQCPICRAPSTNQLILTKVISTDPITDIP